MMMNREELLNFLIEAKQSTYASGSGAKVEPIKPGSKDLPYQKGEYSYMDSYFGEVHFIGQEVVWHKSAPVWGLNYCGYTYDPIEGFPDFLFDCLKQVTVEAPYRGPAYFSNDTFEYRCTWQGELHNFKGEETIHYQGNVIFKLEFHGGIIEYV